MLELKATKTEKCHDCGEEILPGAEIHLTGYGEVVCADCHKNYMKETL